MQHSISWYEIPCKDLKRATTFYEQIFGIKMIHMDLGNINMRMFPIDDMSGVNGAIVQTKDKFYNVSSTDGPLIYLNGNPDVQLVLDKVKSAGGSIVVPKTQISEEHGSMAVIIDSEGNRIALHNIPPKK